MKIVNTIKVVSALVFLSNISYGSQYPNSEEIAKPLSRSTSPVNETPSEPESIPTKKVSNFDYYICNPATVVGIFLFMTVASPFVGCKHFYYAATGYEGDIKIDRYSKFKEGLTFTFGAPLVGLALSLDYLRSKNGGN